MVVICRGFECRLVQHVQGCSNLLSPPQTSPHFPTKQVHNPEYLNDTAISSMVRDHGIRLLAISPHVGNYARQVLEEQGVQVRYWGSWCRAHMQVGHVGQE